MRHAAIVLAVVGAVCLGGTSGETAKADTASASTPFAAVQRIESELERGVSVKADVLKLLGEANGSGECFLPGQHEPREVWFYEDIEVTDYQRSGNLFSAEMRQQLLLVFFKGNEFDGFLWTSNALGTDGLLITTNALPPIIE